MSLFGIAYATVSYLFLAAVVFDLIRRGGQGTSKPLKARWVLLYSLTWPFLFIGVLCVNVVNIVRDAVKFTRTNW